MSKQDKSLHNCKCGSTPTIVTKVGALTKSVSYVYKCSNCGLEGEMSWPTETNEYLVMSWNQTVSTIEKHVKNKFT